MVQTVRRGHVGVNVTAALLFVVAEERVTGGCCGSGEGLEILRGLLPGVLPGGRRKRGRGTRGRG